MIGTVLVIGSGGREHALAWALAQSPSVGSVVTAPGNPGCKTLGPTVPVDASDPQAVGTLAEQLGVGLVVVGPEGPLVAGVADELRRREIPVFGPSAAAATIEGSKAFAKEIMAAAGVPTAGHFTVTEPAAGYAALESFSAPYVVKADGLAAGKGVRICADLDEAREAVDDALVRRVFGEAGDQIVVEEYLDGPERSVFAVCDGTDAVVLQPAQDYKRVFDGDRGPNTGGMGAYTPVPDFTLTRATALGDTVFRPVLSALAEREAPFRGLLYAGLVDTADGPRLLEFNARFGDPETQAILPMLTSDLGALLHRAAAGSLAGAETSWRAGGAVTVVLASGGYPGTYTTGATIDGIDLADALDGVAVFHAGTATDTGRTVTAGGRVLAVTATGEDVADARGRAYEAASRISWPGMQLRSDIAAGV